MTQLIPQELEDNRAVTLASQQEQARLLLSILTDSSSNSHNENDEPEPEVDSFQSFTSNQENVAPPGEDSEINIEEEDSMNLETLELLDGLEGVFSPPRQILGSINESLLDSGIRGSPQGVNLHPNQTNDPEAQNAEAEEDQWYSFWSL